MENVEKLVNLVQARPVLFDVRSVHYKNVFLRKKSWEEIAKIMGCTTEKCMQKWKTLRYKYFAEKKKTKLPSGSGKPSTKKWPFFKYLQFLDNYVGDSITETSMHFDATNADDNEGPSTMDYLSQEGSTSNLVMESPSCYEDGRGETPIHFYIQNECENAENPFPSGPIRNNFDEIVVEAPTPLPPLPTQSTKPSARKKSKDTIEELLRAELSRPPPTTSAAPEMSSTELFFASMAKKVMQLPEQAQDNFMFEMHKIFYKSKYGIFPD
nr:uncharacterized protein LOC111419910 [Onthophagus taurus]